MDSHTLFYATTPTKVHPILNLQTKSRKSHLLNLWCSTPFSLFCYHNNCMIFSWPYVRSFMLKHKSSSKIIHEFLFGIFTSNFAMFYWKIVNSALFFPINFNEVVCEDAKQEVRNYLTSAFAYCHKTLCATLLHSHKNITQMW